MKMKLYKINETLENSYYQMPQELFDNESYKYLSIEAKVIYSFLLNRMNLSKMNHWVNAKGEIYLIEFGQNIGNELCNTHMGIIMQDSIKNSISSTVVVIPISSSPKLYNTHEKILQEDVIEGKLNKLPSKAKAEQITCIDKARLIYKVGELSSNFIHRLEKRLLKNLDIA